MLIAVTLLNRTIWEKYCTTHMYSDTFDLTPWLGQQLGRPPQLDKNAFYSSTVNGPTQKHRLTQTNELHCKDKR